MPGVLLAHELTGVRLQKLLNSCRVGVHQIEQFRQRDGHLKFELPGGHAALKFRLIGGWHTDGVLRRSGCRTLRSEGCGS